MEVDSKKGNTERDLDYSPLKSAANNDSGYLDGSMADPEPDFNEHSGSSFEEINGSASFDEGFGHGTRRMDGGCAPWPPKPLPVAPASTVTGQKMDFETGSAGEREREARLPSVVINCRRPEDDTVDSITQDMFRTLAPREAAFCYITLYDAEWRNLSRRREQDARAAANYALDVAYTRDKDGKRPGFSAMFGTSWDKEAVYKVWKDIKQDVPRADPLDRVLNWVLSDEVRQYSPAEVKENEHLFLNLPERGKHFPNPNPAMSVPIIEGYETSISRCASERGTHGHNSPVPVDPHGHKILHIYKELHRRQANVKDQIVSGAITAETLQQQMDQGDGLQNTTDNASELVHALDHYLALSRACKAYYYHENLSKQRHIGNPAHPGRHYEARNQACMHPGHAAPMQQQHHHHQHQHHGQPEMGLHQSRTMPAQHSQPLHQNQHQLPHSRSYAHHQEPQHRHAALPTNTTAYAQPHPTTVSHAPPGLSLHSQASPASKLYPVHITNPMPFPAPNTVGSSGAAQVYPSPVFIPNGPQGHCTVDARRAQPSTTAANNGTLEASPRHAAALGPVKHSKRTKKLGQTPVQATPPPPLRHSGSKSSFFQSSPYQCLWQRCGQRFKSSQEMYTHVERQHILTDPGLLTGEGGFSCQWHGCSTQDNGILGQLMSQSSSNLATNHGAPSKHSVAKGRTHHAQNGRQAATQRKAFSFKARYQLLIHLQNHHCKDKVKFDDQVISSSLSPPRKSWLPNNGHGSDQLSDIAENRSRSPPLRGHQS